MADMQKNLTPILCLCKKQKNTEKRGLISRQGFIKEIVTVSFWSFRNHVIIMSSSSLHRSEVWDATHPEFQYSTSKTYKNLRVTSIRTMKSTNTKRMLMSRMELKSGWWLSRRSLCYLILQSVAQNCLSVRALQFTSGAAVHPHSNP